MINGFWKMTRSLITLVALILTITVVYIVHQKYDQPLTRLSLCKELMPEESTDSWTREYYAMQAASRIRGLESIRKTTKNFLNLYDAIVPEVFCRNLVRVGSVLDGGKWVCNPTAMLRKNCSIYSLGLHDEISFDHDIQEINNFSCRIHGYDMVKQSPVTVKQYYAINGKVEALKIGPKTDASKNVYFIGDLVSRNNDKNVEFLKIDIEGAEHNSLIPFLEIYKVCQLFVEIHGTPLKHVTLLQQIARLDYALFSYEVNGACTNCCEYSFIHYSCMSQYGVTKLYLYLKFVNPSTN
ncbi:unnamed protein product [Cylicocyclus nassatus]|uniref:Methyltransferase domain-containing protein n=1 Tax=Cylicocyclus nassatus TaxID=53992 RepID=A0AA36H8J6_CYLNA|nr:unnamed protein product [Cylicocyclus nassatus]